MERNNGQQPPWNRTLACVSMSLARRSWMKRPWHSLRLQRSLRESLAGELHASCAHTKLADWLGLLLPLHLKTVMHCGLHCMMNNLMQYDEHRTVVQERWHCSMWGCDPSRCIQSPFGVLMLSTHQDLALRLCPTWDAVKCLSESVLHACEGV